MRIFARRRSIGPSDRADSFNGVLRYPLKDSSPVLASSTTINGPADDEGKSRTAEEAVTINELLLRGCALRNTSWVIGVVVYTGADTKIQLNQGETPSKRSKIEKESNYYGSSVSRRLADVSGALQLSHPGRDLLGVCDWRWHLLLAIRHVE